MGFPPPCSPWAVTQGTTQGEIDSALPTVADNLGRERGVPYLLKVSKIMEFLVKELPEEEQHESNNRGARSFIERNLERNSQEEHLWDKSTPDLVGCVSLLGWPLRTGQKRTCGQSGSTQTPNREKKLCWWIRGWGHPLTNTAWPTAMGTPPGRQASIHKHTWPLKSGINDQGCSPSAIQGERQRQMFLAKG